MISKKSLKQELIETVACLKKITDTCEQVCFQSHNRNPNHDDYKNEIKSLDQSLEIINNYFKENALSPKSLWMIYLLFSYVYYGNFVVVTWLDEEKILYMDKKLNAEGNVFGICNMLRNHEMGRGSATDGRYIDLVTYLCTNKDLLRQRKKRVLKFRDGIFKEIITFEDESLIDLYIKYFDEFLSLQRFLN